MPTYFNPEQHMTSTVRALKEYTFNGFNNAVLNDLAQPSGDEVYDVIMEFPPTEMILRRFPEARVIIHFEIDDIRDYVLGLGENTAKSVYDSILHEVHEQEGRRHEIDFDVGIVASDESGGVTARLVAYEILCNLFAGSQAITKLREATDNGDGALELLRFSGGHFVSEDMNDIRVARMINCILTIRVFSRTPNPIIQPSIEDIFQDQTEIILDPHLTIP